MALCSELQIIPCRGNGDDDFKKLLKELVEVKFLGANQN
jgi:tetraacyldisaccharide 4'-kinase